MFEHSKDRCTDESSLIGNVFAPTTPKNVALTPASEQSRAMTEVRNIKGVPLVIFVIEVNQNARVAWFAQSG